MRTSSQGADDILRWRQSAHPERMVAQVRQAEWIAQLESLDLATADQVESVRRRVRRLARGLPPLESVWIDALAQARLITPLQATYLNAGRGAQLAVGPLVLLDRARGLGYAQQFIARERGHSARRLLVLIPADDETRADLVESLERLVWQTTGVPIAGLALFSAAGKDPQGAWVSGPEAKGWCADELLVHNGRFAGEAVLEIARQTAAALAALETLSIVHGDLSPRQLYIAPDGSVTLSGAGVRPLVRPVEGYCHAELPPECYDYLAPERAARAAGVSVASDVFAWGCLVWHLLTGRPPLAGATSLAKLQAAEAARIADVRQLAPDAPGELVALLAACLRRAPQERPPSWAAIAASLGASTSAGRRVLATTIARWQRPAERLGSRRRVGRTRRYHRVWRRVSLSLAVVLMVVALGWWSPSVLRSWLDAGLARLNESPPGAGRSDDSEHGAALASEQRADRPRTLPPPTGAAAAAVDTRVDGGVVPSAYRPGASSTGDAGGGEAGGGDVGGQRLWSLAKGGTARGREVTLPADHAVRIDGRQLEPGQVVRAPAGGRATVVVPADGLAVAAEGVTFVDIDLVWDPALASETDAADGSDRMIAAGGAARAADGGHIGSITPALVRLTAARIRFEGCTFGVAVVSGRLPVAVVCGADGGAEGGVRAGGEGTVRGGDARAARRVGGRAAVEHTLATTVVELENCIARDMAALVRREGDEALVVQVGNTLHLGPGPLVHLSRGTPRLGQPVLLAARRVTLREATALIDCRWENVPPDADGLAIRADDCAFALAEGGSLLALVGPDDPRRLVEATRWQGQGSVISGGAPLAQWFAPDGSVAELDPHLNDVTGLVRGEVGFEGPPGGTATMSRVVRWQVPLHSDHPPGIDAQRLPTTRTWP